MDKFCHYTFLNHHIFFNLSRVLTARYPLKMTKNPRPTAKSVGTVWYRQALQKNSQHFTESLSLHELRVTLFQKGIISQKEKQQLQKENSNHGDIAESEKLLDFLLNKEEEKLKEFVYTLTYHDKLPYQKLGKLINDTQSKLSKGIGHEDDDGHGGEINI